MQMKPERDSEHVLEVVPMGLTNGVGKREITLRVFPSS